jgi:CheY-like chemotaxis protein
MSFRVLVLQEKPENIRNIQDALPDCETVVVDTVDKAEHLLSVGAYHLIVSAVHLEYDGSVFDFLKSAKQRPSTKGVPFVFYCSQSSTFARSVRDGLQIAARALGAEKYITMELHNSEELRLQFLEFLPSLDDKQRRKRDSSLVAEATSGVDIRTI